MTPLREMANGETFGTHRRRSIYAGYGKVTGSQEKPGCKITLNGKWLEYKTFLSQ